jgi:CRISPR-associated protein Cas4
MVSATQLSSYLYCRRKLFISTVLDQKTPPKEELVKGKIWHQMHELINSNDEKIVSSLTEQTKAYIEIFEIYRKNYSKFLRDSIIKNKTELKEFNLSMIELFKEYWPHFEEEAKHRALNVSEFIKSKNVFGKDLWNILTPKILSEQYFKSEKINLSGIIDVIEIHEDQNKNIYMPVELKTGKVPKSGMWDGHRIQLAAYILLLEESGYNSTEGILHYKGDDKNSDRRILQMNSMLKTEVLELIKHVDSLIKSFEIPDFVDNKNKCKTCPFKEKCYDKQEMDKLLSEAKAKKANK